MKEYLANLPTVDAILQQCRNQLNDTCNGQFYLQEPQVSSRRVETCPFLGDVCINGTQAVEMLHANISAYEIGINSATGLTMSHRLTCAPILLDDFYRYSFDRIPPNGTVLYTDDKGRTQLSNAVDLYITITSREYEILSGYAMSLHTLNGPTIWSTENSGRRVAEEGVYPNLTILPSHLSSVDTEYLLPMLRLHDALPFLAIYRAGATPYRFSMEDPYFAAHNAENGLKNTYYADREATALGCSEQYQFCYGHSNNCTAWGVKSRPAYQFLENSDSSIEPHDEVGADIITIFRMLPSLFSVHEYVSWRTFHDVDNFYGPSVGAVPLITPNVATDIYGSTDRWVVEVETWFTKAILSAILDTRAGARWPLDRDSENFSMAFKHKHGLCGRILFRHPGYTNINWIGTCCTVAILFFICIVSSMMESIHNSSKILLCELRKALARVQHFWSFIWQMVRDYSVLSRNFPWWSSRWNPFQSFSFRRYPGQRAGRLGNPSDDVEMSSTGIGLEDTGVSPDLLDRDGVI